MEKHIEQAIREIVEELVRINRNKIDEASDKYNSGLFNIYNEDYPSGYRPSRFKVAEEVAEEILEYDSDYISEYCIPYTERIKESLREEIKSLI